MPSRSIVLASVGLVALLRASDGVACSCVGPHEFFVGPARIDDAPLNARVRFEVPSGAAGYAGPAGTGVLRLPGGAAVAGTTRTWNDGWMVFAELTPQKPLAPNTRYEVAIVEPSRFPSTNVIGTFKTGSALDTTAPKLGAVGTAVAKYNAQAGGGDCSIKGPWIDVGPVHAEDPGRPSGALMYGVWADASGNVDTSKPPAGLVQAHRDTVTIGKRSLCDPHDFTIPHAPFVTLAIAAIDEAGNQSTPRRLRVDLRGVVWP